MHPYYFAFAQWESADSNRSVYGLSKEKNVQLYLIDEAISLLKTEIELLHLRLLFPQEFNNTNLTSYQSPVYLSSDVDLIDLMEVINGFFYLHQLKDSAGGDANFVDVVHAFEIAFNIRMPKIYDKRNAVFGRKPSKITHQLDKMKAAILKENKERGYL